MNFSAHRDLANMISDETLEINDLVWVLSD